MGSDVNLENLGLYLPKYLSAASFDELIKCLGDFPNDINEKFYSSYLKHDPQIYQGDGIVNLPFYDLQRKESKDFKGMVLSNTCDVAISNERKYKSNIVYVPVFDLEQYQRQKLTQFKQDQVLGHIRDIKNQRLTSIMFLPELNGVFGESLIFFDRIQSAPLSVFDPEKLIEDRIFTLSNIGFYFFLLKLSIHFMRIQESVDRKV